MSITRAGFLAGTNGKLHVSIALPEGNHGQLHWIVHVPAYAEEMNKCRPMVSQQARQLADTGFPVVVPDLFGTGDSGGEFSAANWALWKSDLKYLIQWVRDQGAAKITLWGVRLGCLLAADVIQDGCEGVVRLLLWQPVHSGQQYMTQFLRLRMAASMMKGDSETVSQLRERLLQGEVIEVAGYLLPPAMYSQIVQVTLADLCIPPDVSIQIFEVINQEDKPPLPVTQKQIERWKLLSIDGAALTVSGHPFWTTQEIAFAPSLIEATTDYLVNSDPMVESTSLVKFQLHTSSELFLEQSTRRSKVESVVFPCERDELVGVLHRPSLIAKPGVLIVVGGPQYRIGSHRQFVYLAEALTNSGIPVFRFDYRGMGDSSGDLVGFEGVDVDIRSAIDVFQRQVEGMTEVVIWGLCDAATASTFYAAGDTRVRGLVLVNPWIYSSQGAAKAYLKYYYLSRFLSRGFWKKAFSGKVNPLTSAHSLMDMAKMAFGTEVSTKADDDGQSIELASSPVVNVSDNLVQRFTCSLDAFKGPVFIILSGNDLTAAEFSDAANNSRQLRNILSRSNLRQQSLGGADHTFSTREWRIQVEQLTVEWCLSL